MEFRLGRSWLWRAARDLATAAIVLVAIYFWVPDELATPLYRPVGGAIVFVVLRRVLLFWRVRLEVYDEVIRETSLFRTRDVSLTEVDKLKVTHAVSDHEEYLAVRLFDGTMHKVGRHFPNDIHFQILNHLIPSDERLHLGHWYARPRS